MEVALLNYIQRSENTSPKLIECNLNINLIKENEDKIELKRKLQFKSFRLVEFL